ncbi:uncharacterized protein [Scyliorhinus torazame]|uniref:uncharacterized protein n=1 Tax=Scyliorhinus torazame TaxID=75743 RepID=UPI003B5D0380
MAEGSNDIFEMPTLGRPLRVGMLYDRRSDTFIPGVTLWDLDELLKNLDTQPKPNTNFSIICSDTIEEKASYLDVEASLKASFLGGLVEVSGSAKYLNDSKKSKQQARVTLNYRATTRFEQLTMSQLGPKNITYPCVFDQGSATHVVTAVMYGAQAFFVFDREYSSSDNKQEIEGSLEVMIKKIPLLNIAGKGSLNLSDDERKISEKFSCTFHGDFLLNTNPVSYQDAFYVYSTLPKLLGENGEKAVPLRVWLYPLKMLDSKAAQIVREVSIGLVNRCQLLLDQLHDIEIRCNDLIKTTAAKEFPELKTKIQAFKAMCLEYQTVFQKDLGKILPSIRGTGHEESGLADILYHKERSPFSNHTLTTWIGKREKEMNTVGAYLAMLQGVDILTRSELDSLLVNPMVEHVACFTFTSLCDEDTYLQEMSNYLNASALSREPGYKLQGDTRQPSEDWFDAVSVSQQMRKLARLFLQFTKSNKSRGENTLTENCKMAIVSVDDKSFTGASIFLYEQGMLINTAFEPQKADIPQIIGTSDSTVTLQLKAPVGSHEPVLMFRVEYRCVQDVNWCGENTRDAAETFIVSGLQPHHQYQFRSTYVCKSWARLFSDPTASILTLPAAPPGEVSVSNVQPNSLTITWTAPVRVGDGVNIGHYLINYQKCSSQEDTWAEQRTDDSVCAWTLGNLDVGTSYRVWVSAVCGEAGRGTPSQDKVVVTSSEKTPNELAERAQKMSKLLNAGCPEVYQLPLKEEMEEEYLLPFRPSSPVADAFPFGNNGIINLIESPRVKYWRKSIFGEDRDSANSRTIIVIGNEESGKYDLINGLINYILGVEWTDQFRFQLAESCVESSVGSENQYSIVRYEINHQVGFRVPYSLTIVEFHEQLMFWFDKLLIKHPNLRQCNCLCVVAESAAVSVLENVNLNYIRPFFENRSVIPQLMITSCDGQTPTILAALQNLKMDFPRDGQGVPIHFKFNFSSLFSASSPCAEGSGQTRDGPGAGRAATVVSGCGTGAWNDKLKRLLWDMTKDSLKSFLLELNSSQTWSG